MMSASMQTSRVGRSSATILSSTFRPGEELSLAEVHSLQTWLLGNGVEVSGPVEITQFTGGASNWTYRLQFREHDLVLRRPPHGTKAKSAHDMAREHRVQNALGPHYALTPKMIGLCSDTSLLGAEFYVMEHLEGLIPRKELGIELSSGDTRVLCTNVLDALIALHDVNIENTSLTDLDRGPGYCRRQIEGWSDRYVRARTWNSPSFASVRSWLHERVPKDSRHCLIHNDFRFDNVVLDPATPTQPIGLLDWEMATVGDPLMDLGNALAYWVEEGDDAFARSTRRQPTHLPGMLRRQEAIEYYLSKSNTQASPTDFVFYEVYGLFRLAVIVQQIYYRYHHGESKNRGLRNYWAFPHYLQMRCQRLIKIARG